MKFYNYENLFIASHGNPTVLLDLYKDSTHGDDFIVNPKALVDAFWLSDRHKAEYLGICALRSYNDYLNNKEVDVRLELIPPYVPIEVIKENPLINVTENKIILIKEHK